MEPKIVPVSTGEVLEFSEWAAVIKVAAEATDGTLTVIETRHDPGEGAIHTSTAGRVRRFLSWTVG